MSLLKNFINPWEGDTGVLDMGVLETSILENDVLKLTGKEEAKTAIVVEGKNRSYSWTPFVKYEGLKDTFVQNTFLALDTLFKARVGKLGFKDETDTMVVGNVLRDFIGKGRFATKKIEIIQVTDGQNMYSSNMIQFDDTAGMIIHPSNNPNLENRVEHSGGLRAPMMALIHEFAHAWLDQVNPIRKAEWKNSSGKSYNDSKEHDHIIEYLENPAARVLKQSTRALYRGAYWTDEEGIAATLATGKKPQYKGYDLLYRTINSISTEAQK